MASSSSSEQSNLKSRIRKLFDENDLNPFLRLLDDLFSENKAVFNPAKSLYNDVVKEFPGALSGFFAKALNTSPIPLTRIRCSTLLTRFLANSWPLINPIFQNEIKAVYVKLLQNERSWAAIKIHCTCISSLGAILFPKNDWPEMFSVMLQSLSSSAPAHSKLASVILLSDLIPKCPEVFSPYVDVLSEAFQRLMDQYVENEERVRTATVGAAVKLVLHLSRPSNQYEYYNLLFEMINVLMDAVYNEYLARDVLDEMIVLARARPGFFKGHIKSLVQSMLEITSDDGLKPKTRQLAVQFVVTVAEDRDDGCGMIQNLPSSLIEEMLTQLLLLLTCVKGDESWGAANDDDTEAGKTSLSCYAEEAWSRLAIALRGDVILANPPDMLAEFFGNDNWKKRYAAVTALGLITSGCSNMLVQYLEDSMEKIMELVTDLHPRVRWAAIHTIGEFSKYLSPYLQEQYHQQVIPALLEAMDDLSHPRLQTHAATALLIFSRNCCSNILKPYMKEIMSKLLIFLQKRETMLEEAALAVLASLADSTMDDFQPFYGIVMPYLKLILVTAKEDSDYMLVAKSLKCIAVIAEAVGKSMFCADVEEVVKDLIFLQESNCGTEGEVRSYLLQAWGGLCRSLGEDFLPYLSVSMPQLIQSAKRTDYLTDDDDQNKVAAGNSNVEPRSIILKEKFLACNMLGCFAAHMKGGLHLWIKEAVDAVLPLVNFEFDEQVRIAAASAMPLLLQSAAIAMVNKLPIPDFSDSPIITLSETIISALLEALQEPSIKFQVIILEALNQIIQIPHTWIRIEMATLFVKGISKILFACYNRKVVREIRINTHSDLRKPELLKEEIRDEENIYREIRICLGVLIERLKASFLPFFDDLLPFVEHVWKNDKASQERRIALSVFHDIAENCGEEAFRHYDMCIPFLFKACKGRKATNPVIEEIAACAIGICAEFGGEVFKQHLQDGLSSLEAIFHQHSGEVGLENIMAKEVAISAYGKVCFLFSEEISTYRHVDLWLAHLPLRCNVDEAKDAHSLLCSMIEKPETKVTGPNDAYIPRIIIIMAEVLWAGKHLATEETQNMMIQQLMMFKQKLTESAFMDISRSLPPHLQGMLHDMLS